MKNVLNDQELYAGVEKTIRTVFRVSTSTEIQPNTLLVRELGAESIDFLDLSCDLEKIIDSEVDLRKLFQAKRAKSDVRDLTVQEIVDYLKELASSETLATAGASA